MNRRKFMALGVTTLGFGAGKMASAVRPAGAPGTGNDDRAQESAGLPLEAYEPKSMLHLPSHPVSGSRFPLIDFHTHITEGDAHGAPGAVRFEISPETCLAVMERRNIKTMVDLTGGYGEGLRDAIH